MKKGKREVQTTLAKRHVSGGIVATGACLPRHSWKLVAQSVNSEEIMLPAHVN